MRPCLVDARALRITDRLSGTYLPERSHLSASVAVRERLPAPLLGQGDYVCLFGLPGE
jgi:hypothetical protein